MDTITARIKSALQEAEVPAALIDGDSLLCRRSGYLVGKPRPRSAYVLSVSRTDLSDHDRRSEAEVVSYQAQLALLAAGFNVTVLHDRGHLLVRES